MEKVFYIVETFFVKRCKILYKIPKRKRFTDQEFVFLLGQLLEKLGCVRGLLQVDRGYVVHDLLQIFVSLLLLSRVTMVTYTIYMIIIESRPHNLWYVLCLEIYWICTVKSPSKWAFQKSQEHIVTSPRARPLRKSVLELCNLHIQNHSTAFDETCLAFTMKERFVTLRSRALDHQVARRTRGYTNVVIWRTL